MNDLEQLKLAETLARKYHAGQFRRDGETEYITHPEDVADLLTKPLEKAVAWLHDTIEDCSGVSEETLIAQGVLPQVAWGVKMLSKEFGESYDEFIDRIMQFPILRRIKIADIVSNLTDLPTRKQRTKYLRALTKLAGAL